MPIDLTELVSPSHTALVTQEVQRGVCGDLSGLPTLATAAQRVMPNMQALVEAARAAGVPVIHCVFERREDGKGANSNARIFKYMAKVEHPLYPGTAAVELCPEVAATPEDLVLSRLHGVSPFQGTELDFVLRNLGVTTLVGIGVSVNVAMQNLAFDAVNSGYQVVIPRDAVAGYPDEYVDMVFEHTLNIVATLPSTAEILEAWKA
jgi:nicotinamidase-related amidase